MLAKYEGVERFVVATCKALTNPADKDRCRLQQLANLQSCFMAHLDSNFDITDVTALQERLNEPSHAFTLEDRQQLATGVADKMSASGCMKSEKGQSKMQTCLGFHTMLSSQQWDDGVRLPLAPRIEWGVREMLAKGIRFPSEPTKVAILTMIVNMEQDTPMSHDDFYNYLHVFTRYLQKQRAAPWPPASMLHLPRSGKEYQKLFPHLFTTGDPIESRIDDLLFESRRLSYGSRSTQRELQKNAPGARSSGLQRPMVPLPGTMPNLGAGASPMQDMARNFIGMVNMMNTVMGQDPQGDIPLRFCRSGSNLRRSSTQIASPCAALVDQELESPESKRSLEHKLGHGVDSSGPGVTTVDERPSDKMLSDVQTDIHNALQGKKAAASTATRQAKTVMKRPVMKKPAAGAGPSILQLGCSKCRQSPIGCINCRRPNFKGKRGIP